MGDKVRDLNPTGDERCAVRLECDRLVECSEAGQAKNFVLDSYESLAPPVSSHMDAFLTIVQGMIWYWRDDFGCFAQDTVLDFRVFTGYSLRNTSYVYERNGRWYSGTLTKVVGQHVSCINGVYSIFSLDTIVPTGT